MKLQIIQLEAYDDVISVRDRLSFVNTERVLLVWPRHGQILKRKIDLVLIQREAARRGARLALVTSQPDVIDHAADLNISAFGSVAASQRAAWKHPVNKVFVDRSDRPDNAPDPYELMLAASRLKAVTPRERERQRITRIVVASVLVLVLLVTAFIVGPSADVIVAPAQGQIDTTVRLTADPSIATVDVEAGHIPATLLVIDIQTQASIPTTSSVDVPNTLASGVVVFTNQTGTPVFVPAGTVVTSIGSRPVRFRTTADVTVEGGVGQTAEATIEATQDSGGPAGNIEANLIVNVEGPLSKSVSVRNPEATRGGTIRQQGIVTKDDADNLLILAREKIRQMSVAEFNTRLTGTQFIAADSIKLIEERPEWTSYSAFVGDPADSLTLTLRARVQALVIDEQLARQVVWANLAAKVPPGSQLSALTNNCCTRGPVQATGDRNQATFLMSAFGSVSVSINPESVRQRIAGASVHDALNILERDWLLDPRRPPQILVWPGLWGRLPVLSIRINVRVLDS